MPLVVYIAPMRFYSKKHQDELYKEMCIRAFDAWQTISGGAIRFALTDTILESNINLDWRRIDRKALGHCKFSYDNSNRLFGAEISIGISDGVICERYMAEDEVYHTILHEIGHALGLGHSNCDSDIMYTPHKYGIVKLSQRDMLSLKWLYKFPQGATVQEIATKYSIPSNDIDEIVTKIMMKNEPSEFEKVKNSIVVPQKDLLEVQTDIADLKKYNLTLQNIDVSSILKGNNVKLNPKKID